MKRDLNEKKLHSYIRDNHLETYMSADILPSLAHFLTSDVFIPSSSAIALYIGIPLS